jgi:hypothetical protein
MLTREGSNGISGWDGGWAGRVEGGSRAWRSNGWAGSSNVVAMGFFVATADGVQPAREAGRAAPNPTGS